MIFGQTVELKLCWLLALDPIHVHSDKWGMVYDNEETCLLNRLCICVITLSGSHDSDM